MGEIRNQLKSQNLGALLPSSIEQVGANIFPDNSTIEDQIDFAQIIRAWSSVHNPTFGTPIGRTGATSSKDGNETLLQLTKAQVAKLQFVSFKNAGGVPIEVELLIGGVNVGVDGSGAIFTAVNGGETLSFALQTYVDANLPVSVNVSSGTASDCTTKLTYILTSQ